MAIKASVFEIRKDYDLPLGSLIQQGTDWYMRIQLEEQGRTAELALCLTGKEMGSWKYLDQPTNCVTLKAGTKLELRVEGPIEGPNHPPIGSLVWSVDGVSQAICVPHNFFVTMDGKQSKQFSGHRGFFSRNWGIWLIGEDGKEVGNEPLVAVSA
ncbi:hypothetical protein [Stenotrophomonas maltophilia]|uniref:Uncharacterized protein n=1 Tax=Stenotrophomonas maltophilia TaxID=40324 RepID=A0AAI9CAW1_STEMA|nr:hypothetical protein [Stenotrophomonas maltophilia]EKT4441310.1 hypothetical protein [Stenotrophomonas maltophilia]